LEHPVNTKFSSEMSNYTQQRLRLGSQWGQTSNWGTRLGVALFGLSLIARAFSLRTRLIFLNERLHLSTPAGFSHSFEYTSQTCEKVKLSYLRNYCIDCNQILHSDKDHQVNKSKMADGCLLKNLKIVISLQRNDRFFL